MACVVSQDLNRYLRRCEKEESEAEAVERRKGELRGVIVENLQNSIYDACMDLDRPPIARRRLTSILIEMDDLIDEIAEYDI